MSADQIEATFQLAIVLAMLLVGLGLIRLPPNPRAAFLDPSGFAFRRLMLVGALCIFAVAILTLLGPW